MYIWEEGIGKYICDICGDESEFPECSCNFNYLANKADIENDIKWINERIDCDDREN